MKHYGMGKVAAILMGIFLMQVLMVSSVSAAEERERWTSIRGDRSWFVNTKTMVSPSRGVVSVWEKRVPSRSGKLYAKTKEILRKEGIENRKFRYLQALNEVDCKEGKIRAVTVLFYDGDDQILHSSVAPDADWQEVDPAKRSGELTSFICAGFSSKDSDLVTSSKNTYQRTIY